MRARCARRVADDERPQDTAAPPDLYAPARGLRTRQTLTVRWQDRWWQLPRQLAHGVELPRREEAHRSAAFHCCRLHLTSRPAYKSEPALRFAYTEDTYNNPQNLWYALYRRATSTGLMDAVRTFAAKEILKVL